MKTRICRYVHFHKPVSSLTCRNGLFVTGTDSVIHQHLLSFWFWLWLFQLSSSVRPKSKLRHRRLSGSIVLFQMMCFMPLMLQPVMKILTAIMFWVLDMEAITGISICDTVALKHAHALGNGIGVERGLMGSETPHSQTVLFCNNVVLRKPLFLLSLFPLAKESNTDIAPNLQQDKTTLKFHPHHDDIV